MRGAASAARITPALPTELLEADAALVRAAPSLDWITAATPLNAAEERGRGIEVLEDGGTPAPRYTYRTAQVPAGLRSDLESHLRRLEDDRSAIALLYAERLKEALITADLAESAGTRRFATLSTTLFGKPTRRVVRDAEAWLGGPALPEDRNIPAEGRDSLASALGDEMRGYGLAWPIRRDARYAATVVLRRTTIVLGGSGWVSREERERLCAHEVGVHAIALDNTTAHPIGLFALGTAACVGDHEGAALHAEQRRGVLSAYRRRLVGARAVAAAAACEGQDQGELARRLIDEHGLGPWDAMVASERGFRGGGFAKDLAYIPGYQRVGEALASRTLDLGAFLSGRMRLRDAGLVRDLIRTGVLPPPRHVSRDLSV